MKTLLKLFLVLVLCVLVLGFARGWFSASSSRDTDANKVDVNLKVDMDKVKADVEKAQEKAHRLSEKAARQAAPPSETPQAPAPPQSREVEP